MHNKFVPFVTLNAVKGLKKRIREHPAACKKQQGVKRNVCMMYKE